MELAAKIDGSAPPHKKDKMRSSQVMSPSQELGAGQSKVRSLVAKGIGQINFEKAKITKRPIQEVTTSVKTFSEVVKAPKNAKIAVEAQEEKT